MLSLYLGLGLVFSLYLALTVSSIAYFGSANIMPSITDNFAANGDLSSKVVLVIYLIVLICNIPFTFFAGKTAVIGIIAIAYQMKTEKTDDDFECTPTELYLYKQSTTSPTPSS